jgi:hypothetical protein
MPKPCQCNRWGSGTCGPTASKEPQSKEMKSKLEQMMAERDRQDGMWFTPPQVSNDLKYRPEKGLQTTVKPHG